MTEHRCRACGDALGTVVHRTYEPRCYVYRGATGDVRNGMKFHVISGIRPEDFEEALTIDFPESELLPRSEGYHEAQ